MELAPSTVRKILIEEHAQLKGKLAELENMLAHRQFEGLQQKLREFNHFFLKHIAHEEKILRPALKDIDAWGPVRIEQMNKEHGEQHLRIRDLDRRVAIEKPEIYIPLIKAFIADIYEDMETEEKELLSPDLLRDDSITISGVSG